MAVEIGNFFFDVSGFSVVMHIFVFFKEEVWLYSDDHIDIDNKNLIESNLNDFIDVQIAINTFFYNLAILAFEPSGEFFEVRENS